MSHALGCRNVYRQRPLKSVTYAEHKQRLTNKGILKGVVQHTNNGARKTSTPSKSTPVGIKPGKGCARVAPEGLAHTVVNGITDANLGGGGLVTGAELLLGRTELVLACCAGNELNFREAQRVVKINESGPNRRSASEVQPGSGTYQRCTATSR